MIILVTLTGVFGANVCLTFTVLDLLDFLRHPFISRDVDFYDVKENRYVLPTFYIHCKIGKTESWDDLTIMYMYHFCLSDGGRSRRYHSAPTATRWSWSRASPPSSGKKEDGFGIKIKSSLLIGHFSHQSNFKCSLFKVKLVEPETNQEGIFTSFLSLFFLLWLRVT